uniref:ATP synthase subunit 8 n=1 Tax=Pseudoechthistatus chiangshunani TaxID=2976366 RepID=UPI0021B6DB29|nr:ATP synthase subunit 8 [Pseudoechthistatus chiangshunani]UVW93770.1 ATP synthase subunit 8 [Pseudoechthistatus chiangshunani]
MPQMAPLSWLILFMFFLIIYLLFNISNFYNFKYNSKSTLKNKNILNYNWKW